MPLPGPIEDNLDLGIFVSDDPAHAPVSDLQATGLFDTITVRDIRFSPPTLADLQQFETVLVYTNPPPANAIGLGNVLADYVDAGGHLVLATFAFHDTSGVEGRITSPGYSPLRDVGAKGNVSGDLVATLPSDPIFAGVHLNAVSYFQNLNFAHAAVDPGALLLATDGAGHNMIARNGAGNVAGLNFFPRGTIFANNQELFDLIGNALLPQPDPAEVTLELFDTDGTTVLATATAGAHNFDQGILDFVVPADGVYTIRVSSAAAGRYAIAVTEDLVFDTERTVSQPLRNLDPVAGALGSLVAQADSDSYAITLAAGDTVGFCTSTPFDTLNLLDPAIEVFDPDGKAVAFNSNSVDGKNAEVALTPLLSGVYTVVVSSESGGGEYLLSHFNINDAPVITSATLDRTVIDENDEVTLTVEFTDPDPGDSQTIIVAWGDGKSSTLNVAGSGSYQLSHRYLDDGPSPGNGTPSDVYDIAITVTDAAGTSDDSLSEQFIVNGDFETGDFSGWAVTNSGSGAWKINDGKLKPGGPGTPLPPISGSFDAVATQSGPGLRILSRSFVVPENITSAVLSWSDRIRNYATTFSDPNQEWRVELIDTAGNTIQEVFSTNPGDPLQQIGPNHRSFDLTALLQSLAGQTVAVSFEQQDNLGFFNVTLDDVSLEIETGVSVTVENVDPVITSISNTAPVIGDAAEVVPIHVSSAFTDPGTLDTHTATIDWGDGTTTSAVIVQRAGFGSLAGSHEYQQGGVYTIVVTLTDDDGGTAVAKTTAYISGVGVHDGALQIVGTAADDQVTVNPAGANRLRVHAGFLSDAGGWRDVAAGGLELIQVFLGPGDDLFAMAGAIRTPLVVDAGAGNDHVKAGGGRSILIGGEGSDHLIGGSDEDILIAGTTAFDGEADALRALLIEWASSRSLRERVANLYNGTGTSDRENGDRFLTVGPDRTVDDDNEDDVLTGGAGTDWFFFDPDLDGASMLRNELFANDLESVLT